MYTHIHMVYLHYWCGGPPPHLHCRKRRQRDTKTPYYERGALACRSVTFHKSSESYARKFTRRAKRTFHHNAPSYTRACELRVIRGNAQNGAGLHAHAHQKRTHAERAVVSRRINCIVRARHSSKTSRRGENAKEKQTRTHIADAESNSKHTNRRRI